MSPHGSPNGHPNKAQTDHRDPVDRVLDALRSAECTVRRTGQRQWDCQCPAHDDRRPSLGVAVGEDGRALVHCQAGCTPEAVVEAMGLTMADLAPADDHRPAPSSPPTRRRFESLADAIEHVGQGLVHDGDVDDATPAKVWRYGDAGAVARWNTSRGQKIVRPFATVRGGWFCQQMPAPRPLLRLVDLLERPEGSTVYVVEGEPCVDAAATLGLVATTCAGGSKATAKTDWSPLRGLDVVIVPDHDKPGRQYAADVAKRATDVGAASVRIVDLASRWTDLAEGDDLADIVDRYPFDLEVVRDDLEQLHETQAVEVGTKPAKVAAVRMASDIEPAVVDWLWHGWLPVGSVVLMAGDPGLGKSMVSLDIAARVTLGSTWPDGTENEAGPGSVLLIGHEDDAADTIVPRLIAAGANRKRVGILDGIQVRPPFDPDADEQPEPVDVGFVLGEHMAAVEAAIEALGDCRLLVIDPIVAYFGDKDSHKDAEVRQALRPLVEMARRQGVTVLMVAHLNKKAGGQAIYRTGGSIGLGAVARVAFGITKYAEDPSVRLMTRIKSNLAEDTGSRGYQIRQSAGEPVAHVEWLDRTFDISADEAMGSNDARQSASDRERDERHDALRDLLADGPVEASEGEALALQLGVSKVTMRRDLAEIGGRSKRGRGDRSGQWFWVGPDHMDCWQAEQAKGAPQEFTDAE